MSAIRNYNYEMGFAINGTAIPDPSEYSGAVSALDAQGSRDMTGELHRDMVATKNPLKLKWDALDWDTISVILSKLTEESFQFTFPDPSTMDLRTMKAYCGDRDWDVKLITIPNRIYVGSLAFSVIEF